MSKKEKVGFIVSGGPKDTGGEIVDVSKQWRKIIADSAAAGHDKKILWEGRLYQPKMSTSKGTAMVVLIVLDESVN